MQKAIFTANDDGAALLARSARALAFRSLAPTIGSLFAALLKQQRLRRAERDLGTLEDRMLKDIGIARPEIRRVVRDGRNGHALISP